MSQREDIERTHQQLYQDAVILQDDVDLANVAVAGKLLEYIREDAHGVHFHFTSGTIVSVSANAVQQIEVRGAHAHGG